jgi:LacI family transcriptional regulator
MEALLAVRPRPSAVFAENDLMALGAVAAAHAAGLEVPADLSVVGFDGIEFGASATPPLTTVVQNAEAIAQTTVRLLLEHLGDVTVSPETLELPVSLAVRGSTGLAPA